MSISTLQFVKAWSNSGSIKEVSKKIGCSKKTVQSKANFLIKAGVLLKDLPVFPISSCLH